MANLNVGLFIELSTNEFLDKGKKHLVTVRGEYIYTLSSTVPVIHQSRGCLGVGQIVSFKVLNGSTQVEFKLGEVSKEEATAYENLFKRNSISTGHGPVSFTEKPSTSKFNSKSAIRGGDDEEDDSYPTSYENPFGLGNKRRNSIRGSFNTRRRDNSDEW